MYLFINKQSKTCFAMGPYFTWQFLNPMVCFFKEVSQTPCSDPVLSSVITLRWTTENNVIRIIKQCETIYMTPCLESLMPPHKDITAELSARVSLFIFVGGVRIKSSLTHLWRKDEDAAFSNWMFSSKQFKWTLGTANTVVLKDRCRLN